MRHIQCVYWYHAGMYTYLLWALFGLVSLGLLVILLFRFATLLLAGRGKESLPSALEAT